MKWSTFSALSLTLAVLATESAQSTPPPAPPVPSSQLTPPLPKLSSPIERFRRLLAASPEERAKMLAKSNPTARSLILAKISEFEKLPANDRELRLRVAQLQDALVPLFEAKPEERAQLLDQAADEDRPLLEERLVAWNKLTAIDQGEILDTNHRFAWFVRLPANDTSQWSKVVAQASPSTRLTVQKQLDNWTALTLEDRLRRTTNYQRFFDLSRDESVTVLHSLSPTEKRQMQKALADYATLSPADRARCLRGYRKFVGLSATEQDQFLKNATAWQAMTPAERLVWRRMVEVAREKPPMPGLVEPGVAGSK
ncbi:MAG TPA: DUF3106 domain-containing protein [Candidatus Limnocylindria bacterium]|jgi:hypothetical protein|nr:DUF3106 domain-containing protein [Candidatus Limnocylindria bacterium]